MDTRSGRSVSDVASLLALALIVTACAAPPGRGVGSQPASVVLSLANGNHGNEELLPFTDGVAAATGGTVTIEITDRVHIGESTYESDIIDDVAAGTYDLGWAAPRPWHARGVRSFDALAAPFVVDSYALQEAVLGGDLEQEMLAGLDGTGLVGIGILPGPLRRVAMVDDGFRAPGDIDGKTVGIQESEIASMTFEALGATTKTLPSGGEVVGLDAIEQHLGSVVGNRYHLDIPHVTVDLALWPRPVILFANKARFESLSADQQTALRGVAKQLLHPTSEALQSQDKSALATLCADGSDIIVAGSDAAASLRRAVEPVYDELEKDPATASMLARIAEMKPGITTAASNTACPSGSGSPPPTAGGFPEGTYEARLSCAELETYWASHPELPVQDRFPCPAVMGFTLKDGTWIENYGERWTFSFFGDHVQLGNFTMRWSWDGTQLTFSDIEGDAPDDAQAWTTQPFVKLDDATTPAVGFRDGTYRAQISSEEMTAFWESHDTPISLREACPCQREFTLRDGVWTGDDGSKWEPSFFGDKLTLTDPIGSFTVRWRFDAQLEEVTFLDVEAGGGDAEADLMGFFTVKPFDRLDQ